MLTQSELLRIMRLREQISGNPTERVIMKQAADEIERLQDDLEDFIEETRERFETLFEDF